MKKMLKDKKLYIILLVVLTFFGSFVMMNYSVDTYLLLASPKLNYIKEFISAGRFITAGFFFIQGILQIPHQLMYISSFILAIVVTTVSIYELNHVLDKYVKNKLLSFFLSLIIIINPFIIELWLFIEMGIMMLSVLSCVEAFKYFDSYLEKQDRKILLKSLIWMFIGLFAYQGTVALFLSLAAISILKHSKKISDFIKNNFYAAIIYLIPTIINYGLVITFSRERVGSNHDIIKVIRMIYHATTTELINGFGLLPNGLLPLLLLVTLVISICYTLISKRRSFLILSLLYVTSVVYLATIAPIIPQNSDSLIIFPRTAYTFGSIIGILLIVINDKNNYKPLIAISLILLMAEFYSFTKIETNRYIVNYQDKQVIKQIEDYVTNYEESYGTEVKYLTVYNQDKSHPFYPDINDNINVSPKNEKPNVWALYVYTTDRKVKPGKEDSQVYKTYFKDKHWQYFSLDQVVIVGDTIHWYIY